MEALTAAELTSFQADLLATMPDRCTVERPAAAAPDPFGHQPPPVWQPHLAAQPCTYWQVAATASRDVTEDRVYQHVLAMPLGTAVQETDRIALVQDANGVQRNEQPLAIDTIIRRETHLELALREVTW